jgi:hypothetical protein
LPDQPTPTPLPTRTPDELALLAAHRERALRWLQAGYELHSEPALAPEAETPATLAAEPRERTGKK